MEDPTQPHDTEDMGAEDPIAQLVGQWLQMQDHYAERIQRTMQGHRELSEKMEEFGRMAIRQLERALVDIEELGGTPDSPIFRHWYPDDIAQVAKMAREVKERYGVQLIVKPEIHTREAGRKKDKGYNRAFLRIYGTREYDRPEAFELYLKEEGKEPKDELDRAHMWEAFEKAIDRRLKHEKS